MKLKSMNKYKNSPAFIFLRLLYYRYSEWVKRNNLIKLQFKWRDLNRHNYTSVANGVHDPSFPLNKVEVGDYTYGPLLVYSYANQNEFLRIGSFCSIASGVKFILGGEHSHDYYSTFPFKRVLIDGDVIESYSKGPIIIEDDVWIGTDAIILSGVNVATGTVIAAGSVVAKSTEPYSIIGGNPARLIKKRFQDNIIRELELIDNEKLTHEFIQSNIDFLYNPIDDLWIKNINKKLNY